MLRHITIDDLRGGARLAVGAVVGVTDVAEGLHAGILRPLRRRERTGGLTGLIYGAVRGVSRGVGHAVDGALALTARTPLAAAAAPRPTRRREAVVAVLNGVVGNALAEQGNPLATPMHFRHQNVPLVLGSSAIEEAVGAPSATLVVQVHGICMHDGQLGRGACAPLAEALNASLVSLRYNTGRHISQNGRDFARALDRLVTLWPRPVRRLVIVGHSMGGLVARSAFHYGAASGHAWPGCDPALVMLGSPHHGTHLERLGNGFETLLQVTPYSAPFARLGRIRSAGVTDLRYGNLLDEDWARRERFARGPDVRQPVPLPAGVACYVVAATLGDGTGSLRDRTIGDGLVPLASALGDHPDPARALRVPRERRWVGAGMGHFDLIRRPEVADRLVGWLA